MVSASNGFVTDWGKSEAWLFVADRLCGHLYFSVPWEIERDDRLQCLPAGGNGAADCASLLKQLFRDSLFLYCSMSYIELNRKKGILLSLNELQPRSVIALLLMLRNC